MDSRGWSVAELHRRSGDHGEEKINKSTIFHWLAGRTIPMPDKVQQVASTFGDTYENAMRAAQPREDAPADPLLDGLDRQDPVVVRIIARAGGDRARLELMLNRRRAQLRMRLELDLAEIDFEFDRFKNERTS